ncbi:saccharopine dehydrogenase family protein [Sneathiella glossodoripedis]|uniref:saccharopine dehydrogenase family protein n=1 Tax=Sneathiella glossodoripedis TaxID=418853 RepID=UPI0004728FEF|nr:saccharopine dehydrogenase family protein [Sneathiella glossodoripedis]
MPTIHWLGAGLSSVPGIRRLIENGHKLVVWNRTIAKAEEATQGLSGDFSVRSFSMEALEAEIKEGDVAVSMLPGDFHPLIAKICLSANANFVSSSYIAPAMRDLDAVAKEKGLVLLNEIGLDPGIDHLMAHLLMADYKASGAYDPKNEHFFRSYCGGLSEVKNDFCYKFSWSPLGVLKALRSPSKSLKDGKDYDVSRPWDAVESYTLDLENGPETFEVYPNRDSLPYIEEYGFDGLNMNQFVRGTLRYGGWSSAWDHIFKEVEILSGPEGDARLEEIAAELWSKYAVEEGEADRVVLSVDITAKKDGKIVYDKSFVMDAYGDAHHTAMARLVSTPVSYGVEAVLAGEIAPGVHAAPSDPTIAGKWIDNLRGAGEKMEIIDHLS